jgi:alkylation response protein AidB-like acyl-CoA dehydrogenase
VGATHHTLGEDRPVDLIFDDVRVPASAMVGGRGGALRYAIGSISQARINVGSLAIGKSQYLLQQMIEYASMREAFGKKIGAFQFIQGHIVESSMEIEAALGILRTATTLAGEDTDDARRLAATVKVYATETLARVADRAIQVHGGLGVTRAGGVERFYRDARAMRIYEGTSELLRWNIARWLGLPAQ